MNAFTFVTHDRDVHAGFLQHPQALSFTAVLHVTEIKTRDKDPEAEVGRVAEELAQAGGAVGTRGPGAEPGNGVTKSLFPNASTTPQAWTQSPQVPQEQQLWRNRHFFH